MGGAELKKSESYLDLGILVTSKLSWLEHVMHITKKANKMVYMLSKAFDSTNITVAVKLYKTYVRPIIEFGNSV